MITGDFKCLLVFWTGSLPLGDLYSFSSNSMFLYAHPSKHGNICDFAGALYTPLGWVGISLHAFKISCLRTISVNPRQGFCLIGVLALYFEKWICPICPKCVFLGCLWTVKSPEITKTTKKSQNLTFSNRMGFRMGWDVTQPILKIWYALNRPLLISSHLWFLSDDPKFISGLIWNAPTDIRTILWTSNPSYGHLKLCRHPTHPTDVWNSSLIPGIQLILRICKIVNSI